MANSSSFSAAERAAMKERRDEARRARAADRKAADAVAAHEKIGEMDEHDRLLATKILDIVQTAAPSLELKTW